MEETRLQELRSLSSRMSGCFRSSEALFSMTEYSNSDLINYIHIMEKNYNNPKFVREKDEISFTSCLNMLNRIKDNYKIETPVRLKFISVTTKIFIDMNKLSSKTSTKENSQFPIDIIFSHLEGIKSYHKPNVHADFLKLKIAQLANLPHCLSYSPGMLKDIVSHYEVASQFYLPFVKADLSFTNQYGSSVVSSFLSLALRTKTVYKLSFLLLAMQYSLIISKSTPQMFAKVNKDGLKMMERSSDVVYKFTAKHLYHCCRTAELNGINLQALKDLILKYYEQEKIQPISITWEKLAILKISTLKSTEIKSSTQPIIPTHLIQSKECMNISSDLLNPLNPIPSINLSTSPHCIEQLMDITKSIDVNDSTKHILLNRIIDFLAGNLSRSTQLFSVFDCLTFKFKNLSIVEDNIFFVQNALPLMSSVLLSLQQNKRLKNFSKLFFYFANSSIGLLPESSFQFWYNYIQCETVLSNTMETQKDIQKKFNYISTNELLKNNYEGIIAINCAFLNTFIYSELKPIGCETILFDEMNSNVKFIAKCIIHVPQHISLFFKYLENEVLIVSLSLRIIEMIEESENPKKPQIISEIVIILKERIKDTGLFLYFLSRLSFVVSFPISFKNNKLIFNSDSKIKELENLVISHLYILQAISAQRDPSDIILKSHYLICNYLKSCGNIQFSSYEHNIVETIFKTLRYYELFKYCSTLINQYIEGRRSFLNGALFELTLSYWLDINFKLENYSVCDDILSNNSFTPSTYASMKLLLSVLEYQIAVESSSSEKYIKMIYSNFKTPVFSVDKQSDKYQAIGLLLLYHKFCKLVGKYFSSKDMLHSITNFNRSISILQSIFKNFLLPGSSYSSLNINFKLILKMEFSNEMLNCYSLILDQFSIIGFGKEFDHYLHELELFIEIQPSLNLNYNYGLKLIELNLLRGDVNRASHYVQKVKEIKPQIYVDNNLIEEIYSLLVFENFSRISDYTKNYNVSDNTYILSKQLDNLVFNLINSTEIDPRVSTSVIQKWVSSMMRRYSYLDSKLFADEKLEIHPFIKIITEYHNRMKQISDSNVYGETSFYPFKSVLDSKLESKHQVDSLFTDLVCTFMNSYKKLPNEITKYNLNSLNTYSINSFRGNNNQLLAFNYSKLMALNNEYRLLPFKYEKIFSKNNNFKNRMLPEIESESASLLIDENSKTILQNVLPLNWIAVSIDYLISTNSLIITRYDAVSKQAPLLLNISLNEKDKRFGFQNCINRLNEIIEKSDKTTMIEVTSNINTHEQKIQWWDTRKKLDKQLEQLLTDIENEWFGGLSTLLYEDPSLKLALPNHIKGYISYYFGPYIKKHNKDINDSKLENIFGSIDSRIYLALLKTPTLTDKMVFDTLKFIYEVTLKKKLLLDSLGLKSILKSVKRSLEICKEKTDKRQKSHIVLIPSSNCAKIPWESIPSLRHQSVTRMPTVQQLQDYLIKYKYILDNGISTKKGLYIINPGNDLKRTEENLGPRFTNLEGWNGIIGRAPQENEILDGLSKADLYIYAGHGGGEQYVKSKNIKSRIYTPPALLLGCSSGALKGKGSMHLYGTPYNYINGGCPMVLVNLWDVTDKDIDMFTVDALKRWGFFVDYDSVDPFEVDDDENLDLAQCVAKSRDICRLKYLNGAAPIIYGLPLKLESM